MKLAPRPRPGGAQFSAGQSALTLRAEHQKCAERENAEADEHAPRLFIPEPAADGRLFWSAGTFFCRGVRSAAGTALRLPVAKR